MKRLLIAVMAAAVCGLLAAKRAWLFHESLHEAIRDGLFWFVYALVLGIGIVLLQRKK
jgi:hypothetical protein